MLPSIPRKKLWMVVAIVIVIAGLAYLFFFSTADEGTISATVPASEAELTFVNLAGQLDPIDFDTSLLGDPRFMALVDIRTTVIPEASGRKDPFAPLPGVPTPRN